MDIGVFGARGIPSTYSGYETFLTALLPELARRGHRVTMYCRTGQVEGSEPFEEVERVFLPSLATKQLDTLSHGLVAAVVSRFRRHDVVFVVNIANVPFCVMSRVTGQRIALNTDGQEWLRGKWGKAAQSFFRNAARSARWGASALISDSRAMKNVYREEFGSDSSVIPYSWPGLSETSDLAVLESLGVEPRRYVLIAGRLNPENNIDVVAERYSKARINWPLLVLGSANYESPVKSRLDALAALDARIRPVGHIADRGEFASLVREAATYVHGHSVGGINPSLIEAMGCGANILALDTPFNREALGDTGAYFNLDDGSFQAMIETVPTLPAETEQARRAAARDRVADRFSLQKVADAHELLFSRMLRSHPWKQVSIPTEWDS